MSPISLRFSVFFRLLIAAGFVVSVFVVVVLLQLESRVLARFSTHKPDAIVIAFAFVGVPLIIAMFLYAIIGVIRGRSAFMTDYTLTEASITLVSARQETTIIPWTDVASGTYSRYGKVITLRAMQYNRPIVLMNNSKYESPEWCAARDLIISVLGARLETKWF